MTSSMICLMVECLEGSMITKIKQAILSIIERKRRTGEVLPYATSIEVALLLNMNALEVERIAKKH